jgi:hypothetical protein
MSIPAIDVVRGRVDDTTASELRFVGAQNPDEVVCVLRTGGAIAGFSSVFPAYVELVGNRPFWVYRSRLREDRAERERDLIKATFDALDSQRAGRDLAGEPIGLCLLLSAEARQRLSQEAQWRDPRAVFAGYLRDGRQARIAYFSDQVNELDPGPGGWVPPPGIRVQVFSEQTDISRDDVIALWTGEGALVDPEEAERRADEVIVVAIDAHRQPIGVLTAFLKRSEQLLGDFWHVRAFVVPERRVSHLATLMGVRARDHLAQRFASGEDTRASGIIYEVQYPPLRAFDKGLWLPGELILIGENERGEHVRVDYFAGVRAPDPPRPALQG